MRNFPLQLLGSASAFLGNLYLQKTVYSLSDHEIVDPDTGESLGYLEFVKGTGEVVHVQDKMCTITSVTYRKPVAKKTIRKTTPSMTMWAGSTVEEIVQDDNREQIPFDNPHVGDLAKPI